MKGLSIEGARSPSDTDFFQAGIKNLIPEGHTFKGYPCCFTHGDVNRIFSSLIKATSCRDIFMSRGDKVRFSLSVKKFPYCEGVAACWVMIAVRYRQV